MIKSLFKISLYFVFFISLQILILNNIHLFKIAIPLLYIYIILKIPNNISRSLVIIISFFLGLVIDIFSNTLGMHAASSTLIGLLQQPLMIFFAGKEHPEGVTPSIRSFGFAPFFRYTASLVIIHHVALFCIESITLFDPIYLIIRIIATSILTILSIFITEAFNIEQKNGES